MMKTSREALTELVSNNFDMKNDISILKNNSSIIITNTNQLISNSDSIKSTVNGLKIDSTAIRETISNIENYTLSNNNLLQNINSGLVSKENIGNVLSGTIGASGSLVSNGINIPDYKKEGLIEVNVKYDASATSGCTLNLYYSIDGSNFDTEPYFSTDLPFSAGSTIQKTIDVNMKSKYIKVEVINKDTAVSLTLNSVNILLV